MLLSKDTKDNVMNLEKVQWDNYSEETKQATALKLRTIWDLLPQVTAIEGITKVDGMKYILEKTILTTLEKIGHPISEIELSDRSINAFLELDV